MSEKLSWNAQKKELWKMKISELQEKLQQLRTQVIKQEAAARGWMGDPEIPMSNRRMANTKDFACTLKRDRHRVAAIKTILNIKLQQNGRIY